MSCVKVSFLPTTHSIEFKCVGGLIFDINYTEYSILKTKRWFNSKGQVHRKNGPAIIWKNEVQYWCRYGKYHREDGPAAIWRGGKQSWYVNGIYYSKEEEFNEEIRRRHELRKSKLLTEAPHY